MAGPVQPLYRGKRLRPRRGRGAATGIGDYIPPPIPKPPKAAAVRVAARPPAAKAPPRPKAQPRPKPNPNVTGPLGSNPLGKLPSTGGKVSNPYWTTNPPPTTTTPPKTTTTPKRPPSSRQQMTR